MAAATLVLEAPQLVTLEATGTNLREVIIPAGARYLEYSSEAEWFYEPDTGQADTDAGTAANQQRFDAGTGAWRVPQSGSGRARLPTAISIFVAGGNSAELWLTATRRAP